MPRYSFTKKELENAIRCIYYGVCCKSISEELNKVAHAILKTSVLKGIGVESLIDTYYCQED